VNPNLARIPAGGDRRATAILLKAQNTISQLSDLLRVFGARQDVTPEAFGWHLVQTPNGPDFAPA
jgi:hypothetical protein